MIDLEPYKEKIKSLNPMEGGVIYQPAKWLKHFKAKELEFLKPDEPINRNTVVKQFAKYYSKKTTDYKIPFMFAMVWGYDSNYGPYRVSQIMKKANLTSIRNGMDAMNNKVSDYDEAFNCFKEVAGLGISYLSKVLYFAGKAQKMKNFPLIFDMRVASSFVSIAYNGSLDDLLQTAPSNNLESYKKYNSLVHSWANALDVSADQVEFFLFEKKF